MKSEKYKLIKHLGVLHKSFNDVFNIDSVFFDNIQDKTKYIKNRENVEDNGPEINIESYTSINIYLRESEEPFTEKEIDERNIDISNLRAQNCAFLKYDELYNVTKKFSLLEIKDIAYKFMGINSYENVKKSLFEKPNVKFEEYNQFVLLDNNFRWWPYNLILYDEIRTRSIEKGEINYKSKFFQINPIFNVNKFYSNFRKI